MFIVFQTMGCNGSPQFDGFKHRFLLINLVQHLAEDLGKETPPSTFFMQSVDSLLASMTRIYKDVYNSRVYSPENNVYTCWAISK